MFLAAQGSSLLLLVSLGVCLGEGTEILKSPQFNQRSSLLRSIAGPGAELPGMRGRLLSFLKSYLSKSPSRKDSLTPLDLTLLAVSRYRLPKKEAPPSLQKDSATCLDRLWTPELASCLSSSEPSPNPSLDNFYPSSLDQFPNPTYWRKKWQLMRP